MRKVFQIKKRWKFAILIAIALLFALAMHSYPSPQTSLLAPVLVNASSPEWLSQVPESIQNCTRPSNGTPVVMGKVDSGGKEFYLVAFTNGYQPLQEVDQLISVGKEGCLRVMDLTSTPMPLSKYVGGTAARDLESQRIDTYLAWKDGDSETLKRSIEAHLTNTNGEYWLSADQVSAMRQKGVLPAGGVEYQTLTESTFTLDNEKVTQQPEVGP